MKIPPLRKSLYILFGLSAILSAYGEDQQTQSQIELAADLSDEQLRVNVETALLAASHLSRIAACSVGENFL